MIDTSLFSFSMIVSISWLAVFILIGLFLRLNVSIFQKYSVPSPIIGGFIGCLLYNIGFFDILPKELVLDKNSINLIIYHLLNLLYIGFGLAIVGGSKENNTDKQVIKRSTGMAFWHMSMSRFSIAGGMILIFLFNIIFNTDLLESAANVMNLGFRNSAASGMATGRAYERGGYVGLADLGLLFGGISYIMAILIGIPLANYLAKKNNKVVTNTLDKGIYNETNYDEAGKIRLVASNMDGMTYHIVIYLCSYLLAYIIALITQCFIPTKIMPIFWSNFAIIYGLPSGMFIRFIINKFTNYGYLFDSGCSNRIRGSIVDILGISCLVVIQFISVKQWVGIIIPMVLWFTFITVVMIRYYSKRNTEYADERYLAWFGSAISSLPVAFVLLKILDPELKSPVPFEMSFMPLVQLAVMMPLTPIITPLAASQVFYHKTWLIFFGMNLTFALVFMIIALLPIWKDKVKE